MTLIARILKNDVPTYVGDVMLSSTRPPDTAAYLPAFDDVNSFRRKDDERFVSGAVQKVNILNDRLLVAWAGNLMQARLLLGDLMAAIEDGAKSELEITKVFDSVERRDKDDVSLLGSLLVPDNGRTGIINFGYDYSRSMGSELLVEVAGSGAQSFMDVLNKIPEITTTGELSADWVTELNRVGVTISGLLIGEEFATGGKILDEWWGGAIEVAGISNGRFTKMSDILHVHWNVVNEGGQFALSMVRRLTWYRYIDQWFIVTVIDLKHGYFEVGHHQVSPLLGRREPISAERLRPVDFRCTSFVNHVRLPDGHVRQNTTFDPNGMEFIKRGKAGSVGLSPDLFSRAVENIKRISGISFA